MGTRSGGNQVQRTASSRSAGAPPPSGSLAPPATAQPSSPTDPSFSPLSVQLSSEAGRLNSSTMDRIRRAQLAQMQQLQAQQAQAQAQMRAQQQHLLASQRAPLSPSAYLAQLPPDARAQVDAQINAQLAQYAGPIAEHVRAQYPQAAPQQQQQAYEYYLGLYREQIEGQYANWIIANAGAGSSSDYGGSMYQGSTTSMYVGSTTSMR
ncbi:hypothetical protein DFJ74DRAFT_664312 [Hyaloraphidium curvatum]|nr:hypothetical protein DFJ74DRAFT_664312 [Hyaloraphidium curvatum]